MLLSSDSQIMPGYASNSRAEPGVLGTQPRRRIYEGQPINHTELAFSWSKVSCRSSFSEAELCAQATFSPRNIPMCIVEVPTITDNKVHVERASESRLNIRTVPTRAILRRNIDYPTPPSPEPGRQLTRMQYMPAPTPPTDHPSSSTSTATPTQSPPPPSHPHRPAPTPRL